MQHMFEQPTVIIVGAGASVEFGLPSGQKVFSDLINICGKLDDDGNLRGSDLFLRVLQEASNTSGQNYLNQLREISSRIEYQYNSSIDEYLYDNKRFYDIGKLFSAFTITETMFEKRVNRYGQTKLFRNHKAIRLFSSQYPSWIATLAKMLTTDCASLDDLKRNKITIVTFNYDTLVEDALLSLLQNTQKFSELKDLSFIDILHVNGEFKLTGPFDYIHNYRGGTPQVSSKYTEEIISNSKRIFMVNEDVSQEVEQDRLSTRESIISAKKIYCIGFAFDPRNVSLIGLDSLNTQLDEYDELILGQELFVLNYDGNIQLKRRIEEVGAEFTELVGRQSKPLGCSEAASLGFFQQ